MNTITCPHCGKEVEIDKALEGQIEARVLAAAEHRHQAELEKIKAEAAANVKKSAVAAEEQARKAAADDLEIAKRQMEADVLSKQKRADAEQELVIKSLRDDAENEKEQAKKLRNQVSELMELLREEKTARANADLEAQKKVDAETDKIRDEATKIADEKQRLNLAARDKTISDLQKALDDAQRKASQGSQQLQGEIMELDFETVLADAFRDDTIEPVAKGTKGGDILQIVKSQRGTVCGLMLWEIKRTKNWVDGWIPKLKEDLRNAKANIPIIITEVMPKEIDGDMGQLDGVWICKPSMAVVLGVLLRKGLLDVGREKAIAEHRDTKAEALFNFVTSHEFIQQIESMVETYQGMTLQVQKERVAYEKLWSEREKQAQRLLLNTANIIGSMQAEVGQSLMPRIKGLDLLESGEDEE